MRLLWVEDNENLEMLRNRFFSNLPEYDDLIEIQDFDKAYSIIENRLNQFDFIIFDINLENSPIGEKGRSHANIFELNSDEFLREAGFHLYVKSIELGFPKDRIIFLTGNTTDNPIVKLTGDFKRAHSNGDDEAVEKAISEVYKGLDEQESNKLRALINNKDIKGIVSFLDSLKSNSKNTYELFKEKFHQSRMLPPEAIHKLKPDDFHDWLVQNCTRNSGNEKEFDFLALRRNILNVIENIEQDSSIHLSRDFADQIDKSVFLDGLRWQLKDVKPKNDDYPSFYLSLCDYLSKPYEIFSMGDLIRMNDRQCFYFPLYFLRNWIAHGLIMGSSCKLSAKEAGFAFLLLLKSMFDVESNSIICGFRPLFDDWTEIPRKKIVEKLITMRRYKYNNPNKPDVFEQIHRIGIKYIEKKRYGNKNWKKEDYVSHFYASYLFAATSLIPHYKDDTGEKSVEKVKNSEDRYEVRLKYELQDTLYNDLAYSLFVDRTKN
jgi:hypothetical protein